MTNVLAIIGAGQLGSRHLQGLLKSNSDMEVQVVEPNTAARANVLVRLSEIGEYDNKIAFLDNVSELSADIFLAVVATNSDIRFEVSRQLLEEKRVKFLILEKVLFQNPLHYEMFKEILEVAGTKCWVNHPRRCFPLYKELKQKMRECNEINFSVSGGGWGLGCNSLHFVDLIAFLSGDNNFDFSLALVDSTIKVSKRSNFFEFTGAITGFSNKTNFILNSFSQKSPMQISISSGLFNIFIDESSGWYRINDISNKESEIIEERIVYFQSELTGEVLNNLLQSGSCDLTEYDEASSIHKVFIKRFLDFINETRSESLDLCPIT